MKNYRLFCRIFFSLILLVNTQSFSTFSICAVDSSTQLVGSAGASCIAGSIILSDVHPGVGVIHTQAYYLSSNQNYANGLMDQGKTPQEIVDGVVANDAQGNSSIRQYGVVDLVNNGRSAGFSGPGCQDYKNHLLGKNYAIQGNILLGRKILDSMVVRFLNTPGSLSDKLMAALQGAKVDGADTRCDQYNKSSISAFIRMARPEDSENDLYLDLNVDNTTGSNDPIDELQDKYDDWLATAVNYPYNVTNKSVLLSRNYPNPFIQSTTIQYTLIKPARIVLKIYTTSGRLLRTLVNEKQSHNCYSVVWDGTDLFGESVIAGIYLYLLKIDSKVETNKMLLLR